MQLDYSIDQAAGLPGQIADTSMVQDIETFKNPDEAVLFGHVVTKGTELDEVVHPDDSAEITDEKLVRGVVVAAHECESKDDGGLPIYKAGSVVPVMRKGRIWCRAYDTITQGTSTVNVRYAGTGQKGALYGGATSMETAVLPKSKWKTSTSGNGQLAVLEIDL